jgi:predicted kinase
MKILIITVGLPRSGKSTWAMKQLVPVVNPDSIRLAFHGFAYLPKVEPWIWRLAQVMVESLFLAGHNTVILDSTMVTKARRAEWASPLWRRQYQEFSTSEDECCLRAAVTGFPEDVIHRMAREWEPVEPGEEDAEPESL